MLSRCLVRKTLFSLAVMVAAGLLISVPALANNNGGGGGGDGGAGGGGNNNGSTPAGVRIDPQGVLRVMQTDPRVTMARLQAARRSLPPRLARPSRLRKISLNRLEEAVAERLANGQTPAPEMIALAGLTRIEYVFFYPESGDIVIAGPAEGFARDAVGRIVGVDSGAPCLLLEDLAVALRAFSPNGDTSNAISVSIDPTQEGLKRMQQALNQLGGSFRSARDIPVIVNTLRQSLGHNTVSIKGIPASTHFAHVLTEADYRMKLIGIGLEPPPIPMSTYISRLTATMTSSNALVRWYFVPDYEAIAVSEDGLAMEMVGQGVKLIGEDELVTQQGDRRRSGRRTNPASQAYTNDFTNKFELIARQHAVYGQLRNLIDMTIAAAFIQDSKFYDLSGWDLGVLGKEDQLSVEVAPVPKHVETAINAVMKGSRLITPIGGGVAIQARRALKPENRQLDDSGKISNQRASVRLSDLADGQWWWD